MVTFDLVVGVLSIVLGTVAIAVSWKLFQMSEAGANKMRDAETAIASQVRELDRLFNLLYSDTWSLVRDSYTSMQDQMWKRTSVSAREGAQTRRVEAKSDAESGVEQGELTSETSKQSDPSATDQLYASEQLEKVIVDAYHKLAEGGVRVRAQDLVAFAERLGYPSIDALNSLHDLVFVKKRLFLATDRFAPQAIVADTAEAATRLQEALASETIEEMVHGLPPATPPNTGGIV